MNEPNEPNRHLWMDHNFSVPKLNAYAKSLHEQMSGVVVKGGELSPSDKRIREMVSMLVMCGGHIERLQGDVYPQMLHTSVAVSRDGPKSDTVYLFGTDTIGHAWRYNFGLGAWERMPSAIAKPVPVTPGPETKQ